MLCDSSSRNWHPNLSPRCYPLNFTKTWNCFCCHPSSDHQRNLLTPTSDHIPSLLWSVQGFHPTSRLAAWGQVPSMPSCSPSSDTLVFLPFLQPARSARSLEAPASDPLPQVTACLPPSCHSDPLMHQLLREGAKISPSLSHPSPWEAPWRQGLVLLHRLSHVSGR